MGSHRPRELSEALTPWVCSTPFGDIDGLTREVDADGRAITLGAQRLSATLMGSLHAGRHRRVDHFTRCAQRLSATLMGSLRDRRPNRARASLVPGAQRLSATLMGSHHGCRDAARPRSTRACSTPFGDIDGLTRLPPESARQPRQGAQRLSATLMGSLGPSGATSVRARSECSTPFGDIDGLTPEALLA